jgi:prephenate dehydrogenase
MNPNSIAVIGGRGRMGRLFARLFSEAGYAVSISDEQNGPIDWEKPAQNDVVILAVPLGAVEEAVRLLGPFTKPEGLVIDISSLKQAPVAAMEQYCRGEVIGCHPLFGPSVESLKGHTIFLSPVRSTQWIGWIRSFFEEQGARLVDIEPEEHDKLMATVQSLRHFMLICFARSLMKIQFDPTPNLPTSGKWFPLLLEMLNRQFEQPAELYTDIAMRNPWFPDVAATFQGEVNELIQKYRSADRSDLIDIINEAASYFGAVTSENSHPKS